MWLLAGVLVASFLLAALAGFHLGPHVHALAGLLGILAVAWLVVEALQGRSLGIVITLIVFVLLGSVGVGLLAWKGLSAPSVSAGSGRRVPIEGEYGHAVTALEPSGIVRVGGEDWSAVTLNGSVPPGGKVQVLNARGVHLEVWGEENEALGQSSDEQSTSEGEI